MGKSMLIKTEAVLSLVQMPPSLSTRTFLAEGIFHQSGSARPSDAWPGSVQELVLSTEMWEEMGCPTEITVAVRPGDRLNEEEE